jgi:hypothetical protein
MIASDIVRCLYEYQRFHGRSLLSRRIDATATVHEDEHGILVDGPTRPLQFYIHDLQLGTPAEVVYWHGLAKKEQSATLKGHTEPPPWFNRTGTFRGEVRTPDRSISVIVSNHALIEIMDWEKTHELLRPIGIALCGMLSLAQSRTYRTSDIITSSRR